MPKVDSATKATDLYGSISSQCKKALFLFLLTALLLIYPNPRADFKENNKKNFILI